MRLNQREDVGGDSPRISGSGSCDPRGVIVPLTSEIDAFNADEVERMLRAIGHQGDRIIVDLAAVAFVDSAALRALWRAHEAARVRGQELSLANAKPLVRRVLEIMGMGHLLDGHGDGAGDRDA